MSKDKRRQAWRFGLAPRYLFHLVGVGAFLSLLLIWNVSSQQRRVVLDEMERRGLLLGESLAGSCSLPYLHGDLKTIKYILSRAENIPDVESLVLFNSDKSPELKMGQAKREENVFPELAPRDKPTAWINGEFMYVVSPLVIKRQKISGIAAMLSEEEPKQSSGSNNLKNTYLGSILIKLSLGRANHFVNMLIVQSILATVAIIILGCGIVFFFFRKNISNPIRRLVAAMSQARQGHLEMIIEGANDRDEIGTLTQAFNEMTQDLLKAEQELKQMNAGLEQRVSDRTRDLEYSNTELRETRERVVRSEKLAAIGQLASGVGHELRNPLGALQNIFFYIQEFVKERSLEKEDPGVKEMIDIGNREIKSATLIINDLLDFSKVMQLEIQPTDVNNLLREMKNGIEIPSTVHWTEEYSSELPIPFIDPQRMRQVFINLATNAIQAMPRGGELWVGTSLDGSATDPQSLIRVEVRDSGIGIDQENMKRIFDPLFTTKAKGTGLGLAICTGIVERHEGKIKVSSELGKGTTFTVEFAIGTSQRGGSSGE